MQKVNHYLNFVVVILFVQACSIKKPALPKPNSNTSSAIQTKLQERQIFAFEKEGLFFANNFPSARVSDLIKVNDSTFNVVIKPENKPVNSSPWFAFKVWGTSPKNIYVHLLYPEFKHRYQPKISTDGYHWQTLNEVKVSKEKTEASFKLQLTKDTLTVGSSGDDFVCPILSMDR